VRREQRAERRERERRRENIVRDTDEITVRTRKRIDRRGRVHYATSRHYRVRDRRHRNRYRNGISIYFLPPLGVNLDPDYYILEGSRASYRDYVDLFEAPPVVDVPRRYTLDEIVSDPEIRGYVRSVNVDMITFDSGSSYITDDQLYRLDDLANAMLETLQDDPYAKFLIEGYTDATGSDETNLLLSEDRAAAVQSALIEEYGIPADNLDAVGYGEQYLLVDTLGPERRNRRVTIRPIGDLLADAR
jgi:outer membrane protein OmpA-like peptidoglycan-associated protein